MIRTLRLASLLALNILVIAGCAESAREEATGKASIRGINAIVDAADVTFRIEERSLGGVAFAEASSLQRYDDLSYNFNFDLTVPGESSNRRVASEFIDVTADQSYLLILRGSIAAPSITLVEETARAWEESDTVFEMGFMHLNNTAGDVDVYFAAPGTAPALGSEAGTIGNGERIAPAEYAEGDYVVTVTTAGDPQDVLYQSATRNYLAATTDYVMLFDRDPSRTDDITVRYISGTGNTIPLADARIPPTGRIRHAASGIGNIDLAQDGDFANLLVSNQAFGEASGDIDLIAGSNDYTWTDAGNQGAVILESEEPVAAGFRQTLALVGPVADPDVMNIVSNRRGYSTSGRISFINAASSQDTVDIYLLPAGESVDDNSASSANLLFKFSTGMVSIAPDNYEISVTPFGEKTLLAGPVAVDVAQRDVVEIWILETADPNVLSVDVVRH